MNLFAGEIQRNSVKKEAALSSLAGSESSRGGVQTNGGFVGLSRACRQWICLGACEEEPWLTGTVQFQRIEGEGGVRKTISDEIGFLKIKGFSRRLPKKKGWVSS
ncbi:hypothetical protein U1Q18_024357 [Sarracenia purpurea var. burkii]